MYRRTVGHWVYEQTDILTKQSTKELTLENIDDSVQRLLELVVFLHRALFGQALILLSLVKFDPVLLEKLQGSLSI